MKKGCIKDRFGMSEMIIKGLSDQQKGLNFLHHTTPHNTPHPFAATLE
jgi:hypothetical protein